MSIIIGVTVGTPTSPSKMEEELKPVKTVNGIAPDENGNVVVNGGSSEAGADGFSPIANVTQTASGAVISITDKSGTTTATIVNGKDGKDGVDGQPGKDGVDGAPGEKGDKGDKGDPGEPGQKGEQGIQGIPGEKGEKGDTGAPGADGAKGDKGDKGDTGATGSAGKDGTSVTVKSVSESTVDGGSNVVTFSDGKTLTVKNGKAGTPGKNPVKGTDYWTSADREAILHEVMQALSTPVYGRVDEENNIIITAELADGTYTLKYENADGTKVDIGIVELGGGDVVVDESGPIALNMVYGVKLDKNSGAEGSASGYAASQSIPYDSAYEYTMSTTNDKHAYGTACWYDANGGYLGWNDIIAGSTSGVDNSGVLEPLAGASTFRLRIVALNSGDENRISLRKDLIQ